MAYESPQGRKRPNTSSDQLRRSKRPRSAPDDYFMPTATDSFGLSHPESVQLRLDKVSESVKEAGYISIYHAALEAARVAVKSDRRMSGRVELREFVNSGDMSELYNLSHSVHNINRLPAEQQSLH